MNFPSSSSQRLASALSLVCALSLVFVATGCSADVPAAPADATAGEGSAPAPRPTPAPAPMPRPTTAGPKLGFDAVRHDFGKVDDTVEYKYGFTFRNDGNEVLEIIEVKPSCGCTTTELEKMTYAPGEEGAIELVFHPKGYGPQTKTITVKSNSKGNERITLYINCDVTPFVQFEPRSVRFEEVPRAEGRHEDVAVICRDQTAVFGTPQCTNPNFTVEWIQPPVGGRGVLRVSLKAGAPKGNVINKVKLDVQGVPKSGAQAIKHPAELSASAAV
ncbi:MAG: DUF1573 domain-containing protein, partial [Planctomycetes bacterium]|nr:DUF1573 domain-containing protein [Planctomycetota bacterium]